jgi:hypothetical protein
MSRIALSFGTPEHGWLLPKVSCDGREQTLDVSDVPVDSLRMLATALLNLVAGSDEEMAVTWCLEPDEVTWFLRRHGEQYELRIQGPEHGAKPEAFAAGTMREICAPIWRGLRRLEVDPAWTVSTATARTWSHPFPAKEVALLGERIRGSSETAS